ncbi:hypothetical protein P3L10_008862 [Capsicum annuum]
MLFFFTNSFFGSKKTINTFRIFHPEKAKMKKMSTKSLQRATQSYTWRPIMATPISRQKSLILLRHCYAIRIRRTRLHYT